MFEHETGDMQGGWEGEQVFLDVGDNGPFCFRQEANPRGNEEDIAEGRDDGKVGDISHWMEEVGNELEDEVSACRVPYELDVMWSDPSRKEVLDCKNDLRELCREGCGRDES